MSWKSLKVSTVDDSTKEAEFIIVADVAKETVWMKKFILDLDVVPSVEMGLSCIVIVKVPLLKPRNQDHIQNPSAFLGIFTLFVRLFIEIM